MNLKRRARLFFVLASLLIDLTCTQNSMAGSTPDCSVTSLSSLTLPYDSMQSTDTTSTISFTVLCAPINKKSTTIKSIALTIGEATNLSDYNTRRMHSTGGVTNYLSYQLYIDSTLTRIWGDTNGGSSTDTTGYSIDNNASITRTIYLKIPAKQDVYSGTYTVTPGPAITVDY